MSWICPKCETENPDDFKVCEVCDSPRTCKGFYSSLVDANNGDAEAQFKVAEWYENGTLPALGDLTGKEEAEKWYRKAAASGHIGAKEKLCESKVKVQETDNDGCYGCLLTVYAIVCIIIFGQIFSVNNRFATKYFINIYIYLFVFVSYFFLCFLLWYLISKHVFGRNKNK